VSKKGGVVKSRMKNVLIVALAAAVLAGGGGYLFAQSQGSSALDTCKDDCASEKATLQSTIDDYKADLANALKLTYAPPVLEEARLTEIKDETVATDTRVVAVYEVEGKTYEEITTYFTEQVEDKDGKMMAGKWELVSTTNLTSPTAGWTRVYKQADVQISISAYEGDTTLAIVETKVPTEATEPEATE
jgi:hypothetical protein